MAYDRQASLLTPDQREFLAGEKDLTDDAERMARRRIRERVASGLQDFNFLNESLKFDRSDSLTEDDIIQIYDEIIMPFDSNVVPDALGFLLMPVIGGHPDVPASAQLPVDSTDPERLIMRSVYIALNSVGLEVEDVDVNIEIEAGDDLSDLAGEDLVDLSRRTLSQLRMAGEISYEEYRAVMDEKDREGSDDEE